jgi:hypothetical protein
LRPRSGCEKRAPGYFCQPAAHNGWPRRESEYSLWALTVDDESPPTGHRVESMRGFILPCRMAAERGTGVRAQSECVVSVRARQTRICSGFRWREGRALAYEFIRPPTGAAASPSTLFAPPTTATSRCDRVPELRQQPWTPLGSRSRAAPFDRRRLALTLAGHPIQGKEGGGERRRSRENLTRNSQ